MDSKTLIVILGSFTITTTIIIIISEITEITTSTEETSQSEKEVITTTIITIIITLITIEITETLIDKTFQWIRKALLHIQSKWITMEIKITIIIIIINLTEIIILITIIVNFSKKEIRWIIPNNCKKIITNLTNLLIAVLYRMIINKSNKIKLWENTELLLLIREIQKDSMDITIIIPLIIWEIIISGSKLCLVNKELISTKWKIIACKILMNKVSSWTKNLLKI